MSILRPTSSDAAAARINRRLSHRSEQELKLREAVERWGRARWPEARVVHELVMDRGTVRADVAFVQRDHFAAIEIKSSYDETTRLLHQVGMFRLASPEVWIVSADRHRGDAELIRYLFPSVGIATSNVDRELGPLPEQFELEVRDEPAPFAPRLDAMLHLLWVDELYVEARTARLLQGKGRWTHAKLVDLLVKHLERDEIVAAVCRQLRGRDAFWRADPPIRGDAA